MGELRIVDTADVPAIQHLRLQVRENVLSNPALVTDSMVIEALSGTRAERFYRGRGWTESGRKANGEIMFVLERSTT